ncbi:MAG TPA: hypothetical protein IGS53_15555 [Leptolyngbyaceae cyanobacterium M33_DOE_097]|uniref:S-layer protein n=1 Tax=Oscillatoriales cyanobacterium SpSt-418 TaxID=2282169 RepID=A0A7C3KDI5_9CYAN|nr:hypothetical protein [Leptolyngbyaceae cyanobacterium M33_DOE_097]
MHYFLPLTAIAVSFMAVNPAKASPVAAQSAPQADPAPQQELRQEIIRAACRQNRAETLENPFVDVSRDHWAYKAVLTMHYCGANRQAAFEQPSDQPIQPNEN